MQVAKHLEKLLTSTLNPKAHQPRHLAFNVLHLPTSAFVYLQGGSVVKVCSIGTVIFIGIGFRGMLARRSGRLLRLLYYYLL